jgi:DNA repair exonuclease SbcCD ATPase subunit
MKEIIFNNRIYKLHKREKYYSCGNRRLHRDVYEFHNGKIEKGFEIHHIDGDKLNNNIENLVKLSVEDHKKIHEQTKTPEQLQKRITNLLENASPKAKEWHKSKEGRKWHKEHYEKVKHKLFKKENKKCLECGSEFYGEKRTKFCSSKCKSKYRRKSGVDNIKKVCEVCGKEFVVNKYFKTLTCSRTCSDKLRVKR